MSAKGIIGSKCLTTVQTCNTDIANVVSFHMPCHIGPSVWLVRTIRAAKCNLVQLHDFFKHNLPRLIVTGAWKVELMPLRKCFILYICAPDWCAFLRLPWWDRLSDTSCTGHRRKTHGGILCGFSCFCHSESCNCILCTWNQTLQSPQSSWPWSNNRAPQMSLNQFRLFIEHFNGRMLGSVHGSGPYVFSGRHGLYRSWYRLCI